MLLASNAGFAAGSRRRGRELILPRSLLTGAPELATLAAKTPTAGLRSSHQLDAVSTATSCHTGQNRKWKNKNKGSISGLVLVQDPETGGRKRPFVGSGSEDKVGCDAVWWRRLPSSSQPITLPTAAMTQLPSAPRTPSLPPILPLLRRAALNLPP